MPGDHAVGRGRFAAAQGRSPAAQRDAGAGTVLALGVMGACLALTVGALDVARAVVTAHRAGSAADLAALAGAGQAAETGTPGLGCPAAAHVAAANGAHLVGCRMAPDGSLQVTVEVRSDRPWPQRAVAVARAGRAPSEASSE